MHRRRPRIPLVLFVTGLLFIIGAVIFTLIDSNPPKLIVSIEGSAEFDTPFAVDEHGGEQLSVIVEDYLRRTEFTDLSTSIAYRKPASELWTVLHHKEDQLWYPASVAKLAALPGILNYLRQSGESVISEDFNQDLQDIFYQSSNQALGRIIDKITGTENYTSERYDDERYRDWLDRRLYFERILDAYGLLENQRLHMKTYPSNTSNGPEGAEDFAFKSRGGNRLRTDVTNKLLYGLISGSIEPNYNDRTMSLLRCERMAGLNVFGWGVPPKSKLYGKVGYGVGRFCDSEYIILPNGTEVLLTAYTITSQPSDAYDPNQTSQARLGMFARILIDELSLYPEEIRFTRSVASEGFEPTGEWSETGRSTLFPTYFRNMSSSGSSLDFIFDAIPEGTYEINYAYAGLVSGSPEAILQLSRRTENGLALEKSLFIDLSRNGNRTFVHSMVSLEAGSYVFSLADERSDRSRNIGLSMIELRRLPD